MLESMKKSYSLFLFAVVFVVGIGFLSHSAFAQTSGGDSTSTLTVIQVGSGSGTVKVDPPNANCSSSNCAYTYATGTQVTLTASPSPTSNFVGWSLCETIRDSMCIVTMSSSKRVFAVFASAPHMLTVKREGLGRNYIKIFPPTGGSTICSRRSCSYMYTTDAIIVLDASNFNPISKFAGWSGCDTVPDPKICMVTMSRSRTVTATFHKVVSPDLVKVMPTTNNKASADLLDALQQQLDDLRGRVEELLGR